MASIRHDRGGEHSQILTLNTHSYVLPVLQQEAAAKLDAILGQR